MKKRFNKLVRDNIPNVISEKGEYALTRVLDDEEYEKELDKKLNEELMEVITAVDKESLTEELADLMEVMLAKASINDITFGDINRKRIKKIRKRGSFDKRIFLIETNNKKYVDEDERIMIKSMTK